MVDRQVGRQARIYLRQTRATQISDISTSDKGHTDIRTERQTLASGTHEQTDRQIGRQAKSIRQKM